MADEHSTSALMRSSSTVGEADVPIPFELTAAGHGVASSRMVPARLRDVAVQIPCPVAWCRLDHVKANELFPEDIYHQGATSALSAPVFGGTENVLVASVRQTPFGTEHDGAPYLCLDVTGDSDVAELSPTEALAFADQLDAHADQIRRQARVIQGGVA